MSEVERRPNGLSEKEEALIADIANEIIALANEKKFSFIPTWEQYELATESYYDRDPDESDPDVFIYDAIAEVIRSYLEVTVDPLSDRPYKFKETLRKPETLPHLFEIIKEKLKKESSENSDQTLAPLESQASQIR